MDAQVVVAIVPALWHPGLGLLLRSTARTQALCTVLEEVAKQAPLISYCNRLSMCFMHRALILISVECQDTRVTALCGIKIWIMLSTLQKQNFPHIGMQCIIPM